MTAFQALVYGIIGSIGTLLPLPAELAHYLLKLTAGWENNLVLIQAVQNFALSAIFIYWLRHEWLGLITAAVKLVIRPHKPNNLDEQQVLFLGLINVPIALAFAFGGAWVNGPLDYPVLLPVFGMIGALAWRGVFSWGKQIKGSNHIRLVDALIIGALGMLSAVQGFGVPLVVLCLFILINYNLETGIRFTSLSIGIQTFVQSARAISNGNLESSWDYFGALPWIVLCGCTLVSGTFILDALNGIRADDFKRRQFWLRLLGSTAVLICAFIYRNHV